MKLGWIAFIFFCSTLLAEEQWQPLPAPMLTLEERYPVDLDEKERRTLTERNETERNVALFKEREVPWFSLLLLGAAIVYVVMGGKKEKKKEISQEELVKTLQEQTIHQLEQLKPGMLEQTPDLFYVALTRILRSYIEQHYELPAETSTTEEFFSKIQTSSVLGKKDSQGLSEFLQSADRVKFARQDASEADRQEALDYALAFVRRSSTI